MTNTKPYHIYIALTRAVDNYCERHDISRGAFAVRVGFRGDNAENQLSNHLNPRSMKNISHEREYMILQELDDISRELYFSKRGKEWGLSVDSGTTLVVSLDTSFHTLADEAFSTTKKALKDGVLIKKEVNAIRKESKEAVDFYQKMVDLAELKLREM